MTLSQRGCGASQPGGLTGIKRRGGEGRLPHYALTPGLPPPVDCPTPPSSPGGSALGPASPRSPARARPRAAAANIPARPRTAPQAQAHKGTDRKRKLCRAFPRAADRKCGVRRVLASPGGFRWRGRKWWARIAAVRCLAGAAAAAALWGSPGPGRRHEGRGCR